MRRSLMVERTRFSATSCALPSLLGAMLVCAPSAAVGEPEAGPAPLPQAPSALLARPDVSSNPVSQGGDRAPRDEESEAEPIFSQPVVLGDTGVGPLELLAISSTCAYATSAADDFTLDEPAFVSRISWEGVYFAFGFDFPEPDESIRITIFEGRAGSVQRIVRDEIDPPTVKTLHGRPPIFGQNVVYSYVATLEEPLFLRADRQYWISINVDPAGLGGPAWGWCASAEGNAADTPQADQPWQDDRAFCSELPVQRYRPGAGLGLDADLAFALFSACEPDDCDCDGISDAEALASGLAADCNDNGVPDVCDILFGPSQDCDDDGVPDECQLGVIVDRLSPRGEPIGTRSPRTLSIDALPLAVGPVEVEVIATADLSASNEWIDVIAENELLAARLFAFDGADCAPDPSRDSFTLDADAFNDLLDERGDLSLDFVATSTVDPSLCSQGFLQFRVRYPYRESRDCNGNGVPDGCDIATGASRDCNEDGVPDDCQYDKPLSRSDDVAGPVGDARTLEHHLGALAPAIGDATLRILAEGDLDGTDEYFDVYIDDEHIGSVFRREGPACGALGEDALVIDAARFNFLARMGRFTVRLVPSSTVNVSVCPDGSTQVVLDYLSLDAGDCDADGVLDSCQIAAGLAFDSNSNGLLDACERSADFNVDGVVSPGDLAMLLAAWGSFDQRFDLDGSGRIDGGDLAILLAQFD